MTESLGHETRDVTVVGALQRHQLRSYLNKAGITYEMRDFDAPAEMGYPDLVFRITATPDQWVKVDEWIERIKEGL